MPRHRGLGEECTTFVCASFRKGARSNPGANSKQSSNELETKKQAHARERPKTRGRAFEKTGLDLNLVRDHEKETRFKECELKKERKNERRER